MTTLQNRPHTALLVIDVQNGVVKGAHERDTVVANVGRLVEKARRERVPVVWVQHSDDGLAKGSDDPSAKTTRSSRPSRPSSRMTRSSRTATPCASHRRRSSGVSGRPSVSRTTSVLHASIASAASTPGPA